MLLSNNLFNILISKNPTKFLFEREFRIELELEVYESEDYSEFPACEPVEQKHLCYNCKRRATTTGLCVKKEDKATQTVSRKVWKMPSTIVLFIQGLSPLQGGRLFI